MILGATNYSNFCYKKQGDFHKAIYHKLGAYIYNFFFGKQGHSFPQGHVMFLFSLFVYGRYKTSHMKKPSKITENFLFSVSIYGVAEENGFCDKLTTRWKRYQNVETINSLNSFQKVERSM